LEKGNWKIENGKKRREFAEFDGPALAGKPAKAGREEGG
jgi:hypothetical protein